MLVGSLHQESRAAGARASAFLAVLFLGVALAPSLALAAPAGQTDGGRASEAPASQPVAEAFDFSDRSDYELTDLGARWEELSAAERRGLLKEVRARMAQRKERDGVLTIRTQRRYGRIYRAEDGRYLKIETRVVQVRPATRSEAQEAFGVGFEKRSATTQPVTQDAGQTPPGTPTGGEDDQSSGNDGSPPVLRVNDALR